MISLNTQVFLSLNTSDLANSQTEISTIDFSTHPQWNHQTGWKNVLNNFRLIIQPTLLLWLVFPWLDVLPNSSLPNLRDRRDLAIARICFAFGDTIYIQTIIAIGFN